MSCSLPCAAAVSWPSNCPSTGWVNCSTIHLSSWSGFWGPLRSAWASASRLVLSQTEVATKTDEITAIPELLQLLEFSDCIVAIDAIGCQKAITQQITESGADNVLALKQNRPQLYEAVATMFTLERQNGFADVPHDSYQTVKKTTPASKPGAVGSSLSLNSSPIWTLTRNGRNSKARSWSKRNGNCPIIPRWKLATSSPACLPMPNCIRLPPRSHWSVENLVHWVLDVAFREDDSRIRQGHAQHNLAILRRLALNLLEMREVPKLASRPNANEPERKLTIL